MHKIAGMTARWLKCKRREPNALVPRRCKRKACKQEKEETWLAWKRGDNVRMTLCKREGVAKRKVGWHEKRGDESFA